MQSAFVEEPRLCKLPEWFHIRGAREMSFEAMANKVRVGSGNSPPLLPPPQ